MTSQDNTDNRNRDGAGETSYMPDNIDIERHTDNKYREIERHLGLCKTYLEKSQYNEGASHAKVTISIIQEMSTKIATEMNACDSLDDAGIYRKDTRLARAAAVAYYNLGQAQACLAMYQDSLFNFHKCAEIATEIGLEDIKLTACYTIAKLYESMCKWNDVVEYSNKFIDRMNVFCSKEKEIEANVRLANAYVLLNQYDKAVVYAKKCVDMIKDREHTYTSGEIDALFILARSYMELNKKDEAIQYGKVYLEIAKNTCDEEMEMDAHGRLASIYIHFYQLSLGFHQATEGMRIAQKLQNDNKIEEFNWLLSEFYAASGMIEKAASYKPFVNTIVEVPKCVERELEALEKARKEGDGLQLSICYWRLFNYYRLKYEYEKAIEYIEKLMALQPNCNSNKVLGYIHKGQMYLAMKKFKDGLLYCETGLSEVEKCKEEHFQSTFFHVISRLYAANDKLDLAEIYVTKAIQCFEDFYGVLGSHDDFKISVVDQYAACFKFLSVLCLKTNRKEEALLVLDRCRARALKDLLVIRYGIEEEPEGSGKEHIEYSDVQTLVSSNKFAILYYSFSSYYGLAFLVHADCLETSVQKLNLEQNEYNQIIDKMFEEIQVGREVKCEDRVLDVGQDIEQQQKQEEDEDDERKVLIIQLKKRNFVVGKREILMYDNEKNGPVTVLELLFSLIVGEGESLVKQDEIVFIPDGFLCKIPFAALRDPDTGEYLSETKRIRVAPSIATLKLLQESSPTHHCMTGALIIGDPAVGKVMMDGKVRDIEPLDGAREEAADIALILNIRPFLTQDATKDAVIKELQKGVSVVHIAAHGILSKATIVLAPSPEIRATKIPDEKDYMLTMADVQKAQVRAQLVVLSCCHSGRGEIRAEGVVGMCRAFLASGARAVVASLWAIDDKATRKFMKKFYNFLKEGKSASTSLHLTMEKMRQHPKYNEPKYWAAFFLMGDDVTLKWE